MTQLNADNSEYPTFLITSEVADIFRVNQRTVRRWASAGKLPCIKTPGGHFLFDANVINALT